MSAELFNMRHGESVANRDEAGLFGDENCKLAKVGRRQSLLGGGFATDLEIGVIVCGPQPRHRQTALGVRRVLGPHIPIVIDIRAREQSWGSVVPGTQKSDVFDDPEIVELADAFGLELRINPEAESEFDVADRMLAMYADYQDYPTGNVLIVSSNTPCKAVQGVSHDMGRQDFREVEVPNGSIAPIDLNDPNIRTPIFVPKL